MQNVVKQAFTETSASGTELTINNTIEARMEMKLNGNTSQNGEPTPSSPIDVNVVSGSNIVYTSNKNLFNPSNIIANTNIDANGNLVDANNFNLYYISVISGEKYTMTRGQSRQWVYAFSKTTPNKGQQISTRIVKTSTMETFTVPDGYNYIVVRQIETSGESINSLMILKGTYTTAPGYEPHQGKEFPLDLGNIELCKIGDYQDYFYKSGSKWYLHKEINKITSYNGETITTSYISTTGELSTGAKVYYVVTPTDTKITDTTLITQLDEISQALSQKGTTIISQRNDDLPFNLDVIALTK